jgi:predicted RNA-binding protein with PIN domain
VPDAPADSTPRPDDSGARVAERQRETAPATPADGTPPSPCAAADESGARRTPLALPGGVFDDSIEAAEHLLRVPGAALVVDGYNVTMFGWPELGKSAQRSRLLNALSDLALRTATDVELVFDGAEVEALPAPPSGGARVRVRFSAPDIEADDVIIDLVGCIPAVTPVIVASSDNRVRAGVQRLGANVLHNHQLVGVLRR